jgi:hypothetical protein
LTTPQWMELLASLGFSLINRAAAGRCVFSTSLLAGQDVHGTRTCWAGRQAGVRACYSAHVHYWVCTKVLGHDTTAHPSMIHRRLTVQRMVRAHSYVLYWRACAMSSTNHDGLTCVYCIRGGLALCCYISLSIIIFFFFYGPGVQQHAASHVLIDLDHLRAWNKRRTYCVVIYKL